MCTTSKATTPPSNHKGEGVYEDDDIAGNINLSYTTIYRYQSSIQIPSTFFLRYNARGIAT
jgi:hypothetical protein